MAGQLPHDGVSLVGHAVPCIRHGHYQVEGDVHFRQKVLSEKFHNIRLAAFQVFGFDGRLAGYPLPAVLAQSGRNPAGDGFGGLDVGM